MSGDLDNLADAGMLDLFRMEVETHVASLETGLVDLESGPVNRERVEPLMRAAHSIKGAARIMGLNSAVSLAHGMEDIFVAVQEGTFTLSAPAIDQLLKGVDLFKRLSVVAAEQIVTWLDQHAAEVGALAQDMIRLREGGAPAPAPTAPPAPPASAATPPAPAAPLAPAAAPVAVPLTPAAAPAAVEERAGVDSAVRVTSETLNRLMGLAGECMVEARRLAVFGRSFLQSKDHQFERQALIERLLDAARKDPSGERVRVLAQEILEKSQKSLVSLGETLAQYGDYSIRSEELTTRLYNEAIAAKMRPFSDGTKGFPRMVRDLARELGKKIHLKFVGESTRVDREILARLEAPLNHLLRNACDHGLETPEQRLAAGKPEEGEITLEAAHKAGMLFITVSDDGRGIDPEAVRRKVIEKKLATPEMVANMSESELMDFLFLPGFSTASSVTQISGRGVGMDVVQTMIQEVGGLIRVHSELGKGASMQLQLPLTLSVIRALIVEVAGEHYAFHLSRVDRVLKISKDAIQQVEDRQYVSLDGENIGLIPVRLPLGIEETSPPEEPFPIVVISDRLNRYGVVVSALVGERELVVRPLDARLGKIPDIGAAAILEDGSTVLILDVDDLVRSIDHLLAAGTTGRMTRLESAHKSAVGRRILVVDDSITVREVERRLLENHGYKVDVAVDGMDGWNRARESRPGLVITDIDMPRMNGIELVTRLKKDLALKDIPVMIVSYKDREEDRLKGLEAGADYYLTKSSFHDASLLEAVRRLLGEDA